MKNSEESQIVRKIGNYAIWLSQGDLNPYWFSDLEGAEIDSAKTFEECRDMVFAEIAKTLTKEKRREIYLFLAEEFLQAHLGDVMFSRYVCSRLAELVGVRCNGNLHKSFFPEFFLFEPNDLEKESEGISPSCSAWWDISRGDVFQDKAMTLLFCAEMCK